MTPVALNAALIACLSAGVADLTLLNLSVVPALHHTTPHLDPSAPHSAHPEPSPGPSIPATQLAASTAPAQTSPSESPDGNAPKPAPTLIVVLEFETSSHRVDTKARIRLRQSLAALRDAPRILIVGHTDEAGPEAYNDRLSRERAEAALRQLMARDIPAERVELVARGEHELLTNGNSRRVEIYRGGEP